MSLDKDVLLFRIIERSGREYKIFTNGKTEGFEENAITINRFPILLRMAQLSVSGSGGNKDLAAPLSTNEPTSDLLGRSHSTPP